MIFTESFLWVHTPKTAGMSLQNFLANSLNDEIIYLVTKSKDHDLSKLIHCDRKIEHIYGGRHLNINESLDLYREKFSSNPKMILTVIRDPIELIFSYYHHLLKPQVLKQRGMTKDNNWGHPKLAREENFSKFGSRPNIFYGLSDKKLMNYYQCDYDIKLEIVPLNFLNEYFSNSSFFREGNATLEKRNSSKKTKQVISADTKQRIYKNYPKYSSLFNNITSSFLYS
jgi:hypothetical protein